MLLPMAVDASSVVHSKDGSQLRLSDGSQINTRLLLDCSGYQSTLVELDGVHNPGVQVCTRGGRGREGRKEGVEIKMFLFLVGMLNQPHEFHLFFSLFPKDCLRY